MSPGEAEFEGEAGGLALGAEDAIDLDPAADDGEALVDVAIGEDLPGGGGILVLDDPGLALALGARRDQVPEPEPHPGAVADGALLESVRLVARDVGLQVQAVGRGDEQASVEAIGRGIAGRGPVQGAGAGETALVIQGQGVLEAHLAEGQFQGAGAEQGVVGAVEEVVVLEAETDAERGAGGDGPGGLLGQGNEADGGLGDGVRRHVAHLGGPGLEDGALAAAAAVVGRGDHVAGGRQTGRPAHGDLRRSRIGVAGDAGVRDHALDTRRDLLGAQGRGRRAVVAHEVIGLPEAAGASSLGKVAAGDDPASGIGPGIAIGRGDDS